MSVWVVAGLWGRIGWFPDLVYMKITQIGGKDLIISAIPAGLYFSKSRFFIIQAYTVVGIAQTSRYGFSATAILLAPLSLQGRFEITDICLASAFSKARFGLRKPRFFFL